MKKFLRRLLVFLLVVSLLVGGFLYWEHWRGTKALNQWKEQVRGKGEKLEIKELLPPAGDVPDPRPQLLEALQPFTNAPVPPGSVDVSTLFDAGRIRVAWQQRQIYAAGMNVYNWRDLERVLQASEENLKKIREAAAIAPARLKMDYEKARPVPVLAPVRISTEVLSASAMVNLKTNNLAMAIEDLKSMASLARFYRDEPMLVILLVRSALANYGIWSTWQALQAPGWTDGQLQEVQQAWQQVDLLTNWVRTFEFERALTQASFNQFRRSRYVDLKTEHASMVKGNGEVPLEEYLGSYVLYPAWKFAWSPQLEHFYLNRAHTEVELARQGYSRKSIQPIRARVEPAKVPSLDQTAHQTVNWMKSLRSIFSDARLTPDASSLKTPAHVMALKAETAREMLVTAIALKRFQLAKGRSADQLQDLVPEYLPRLPIDWMDGSPLRYKVVPNRAPLLYSVGEDMRDENGVATWKAANPKNPTIWEGTDAVWPVPYAPR